MKKRRKNVVNNHFGEKSLIQNPKGISKVYIRGADETCQDLYRRHWLASGSLQGGVGREQL